MIPFLDPPGALSFNWSLTNTSAILVSALLGFFLQWSGALALGWVKVSYTLVLSLHFGFKGCVAEWFLKSKFCSIYCRATSAITHVVLGQFKTCVLLLGNYYIFGSNSGFISVGGAFVAIMGTSLYTYLNTRGQSLKTSSSSSALSEKKSRFSDLKDDDKNLEPYGSEAV